MNQVLTFRRKVIIKILLYMGLLGGLYPLQAVFYPDKQGAVQPKQPSLQKQPEQPAASQTKKKKKKKKKKSEKATAPQVTPTIEKVAQGMGAIALGQHKALPQSAQQNKVQQAPAKAPQAQSKPQPKAQELAPAKAPAAQAKAKIKPKPKKKKTVGFIVKQSELQQLEKKYQAGFVVIGSPQIAKVYLTLCTLQHVFGMEIINTAGELEPVYLTLTGFHHDSQCELVHKIKPFYFSARGVGNGIREGFIAYDRTHVPVYKSFFSVVLSRDEVINMLIESLQHINKSEMQQGGKILLEGTANNGVKIRTIPDKNSGEIITFFPVTQKPAAEIKAETEEITRLFKKHFYLDQKNKPRMPVTPQEIEQLYTNYKEGIPFNFGLLEVTPKFHPWSLTPTSLHADYEKLALQPEHWQNRVLVPNHLLPHVLKKYPHEVSLIQEMNTLHFTPQRLQHIFTTQDKAFPPNMTRQQILNIVNDILANAYQGGGSYDFDNGPATAISEPTIKMPNNQLWFVANSHGADKNDIYQFLIKIDIPTGEIIDFYPLFG